MSGLRAGTGRRATGGQLLSAAWSLLRSNRSLVALPVLSAVFSTVAVVLVMAPALIALAATDRRGDGSGAALGAFLLGAVAVFVSTAIGVYFQVALVAAVFAYLDGEEVGIGRAMALASRRLGAILAWSLLAATVGVILRAIQERGILGAIAGLIGSVAWAIASFFVVPIIAAEGLSPFTALRRSTDLVRTTWGPSARATLRYGLVMLLVVLPAIAVVALVVLTSGRLGAGELALVGVAIVYLCVAGIVLSALGSVVRGVLYRYATGRPVPGVDTDILAAALR